MAALAEAQLEPLIGHEVLDYVGERIGALVGVYSDTDTGQPVWLSVRTGLADRRIAFVPLEGARLQGSAVAVVFDKEQVITAPFFDVDQDLSPREEDELARHYRWVRPGGDPARAHSGQERSGDGARLRSYQRRPAPVTWGPAPPTEPGGQQVEPMYDDPQAKSKADAAREVAGVATDQARQVTQTAAEQTKQVAATASDQVRQVGQEAVSQARSLVEEAKSQSHQQAKVQTDRAAEALVRLRDQAQALVEGRQDEAGPLAGYAQQGLAKLDQLAERVSSDGFDGVVADLQRFARRRPAAFLLAAGAIGFGAGRLVRAGTGQATTGGPALGGPGTGGAGLGTSPDPLGSGSVYSPEPLAPPVRPGNYPPDAPLRVS